jgi:hypothetical protein
VRQQIRAAEELGLHSWVLWNPRSAYDAGIFRPEGSSVSLTPAGAPPDTAGSPAPGTH